MSYWSPDFLAAVAATFFVGGLVKGTIGFGLPLIGVAVLAPIYGITTALALLVAPGLATNLVQSIRGGHLQTLVRRLATYLAGVCAGMFAGVAILAGADQKYLVATLGVMISVYAVASLLDYEVPAPGRLEPLTSPAVGTVNGLLSGMTGVYVFPAAMYLRALGLDRDQLVQALGIVFMTATIALAVNLGGRNLLTRDLAVLSVLALIPTLAGQWMGQKLRQRVSDVLFRKLFLAGLFVVGIGILVRALLR